MSTDATMIEKVKPVLRLVGGVITSTARRFADDQCLRMAASLSYTSLLAVVPLTAIAFAMLAAFPVFEGVRDEFQSALFANLIPSAATNMQEYFQRFVRNTSTLSAVGIVGLAVTAVLLLSTIESALNTIFRVSRARRLGPRLLVFWTVITLGPLLLGASFSLSTYFFAATEWAGIDLATGISGQLARATPTFILMALLALFYVTIPNRPVNIWAAIIGAIVAGLLIAMLRKVFGIYVASFPTYQNIYGALSALPIFLIWMYLSWAVVLWGAALTATIGEWRANGGRPPVSQLRPGSKLTGAISILAALNDQRGHGGGVPYRHLLRRVGVTDEVLGQLLKTLRESGYAERTPRDHWVLSRDLSAVTVHDLYRTLGLGFDDQDASLSDQGWQGQLADVMEQLRERNLEALGVPLQDILAVPENAQDPVDLDAHRGVR